MNKLEDAFAKAKKADNPESYTRFGRYYKGALPPMEETEEARMQDTVILGFTIDSTEITPEHTILIGSNNEIFPVSPTELELFWKSHINTPAAQIYKATEEVEAFEYGGKDFTFKYDGSDVESKCEKGWYIVKTSKGVTCMPPQVFNSLYVATVVEELPVEPEVPNAESSDQETQTIDESEVGTLSAADLEDEE